MVNVKKGIIDVLNKLKTIPLIVHSEAVPRMADVVTSGTNKKYKNIL